MVLLLFRWPKAVLWGVLFPLLPVFVTIQSVSAEKPIHLEEDVKAAFIYNFTKFVQWPDPSGPADKLVIGYWGDDSMMTAIKKLEGRKSQDRFIEIKHISGRCDIDNVNVLVISRDQPFDEKTLRALAKKDVLTVAEGMDSLEKGVIIALYKEEDKIRFAISLRNIKGSKLKISSRLLKLAKRVIK